MMTIRKSRSTPASASGKLSGLSRSMRTAVLPLSFKGNGPRITCPANDLDGIHLVQQRRQRTTVQPAGAQHKDAGPAFRFASFLTHVDFPSFQNS